MTFWENVFASVLATVIGAILIACGPRMARWWHANKRQTGKAGSAVKRPIADRRSSERPATPATDATDALSAIAATLESFVANPSIQAKELYVVHGRRISLENNPNRKDYPIEVRDLDSGLRKMGSGAHVATLNKKLREFFEAVPPAGVEPPQVRSVVRFPSGR